VQTALCKHAQPSPARLAHHWQLHISKALVLFAIQAPVSTRQQQQAVHLPWHGAGRTHRCWPVSSTSCRTRLVVAIAVLGMPDAC
jgi:hypothetical protein